MESHFDGEPEGCHLAFSCETILGGVDLCAHLLEPVDPLSVEEGRYSIQLTAVGAPGAVE